MISIATDVVLLGKSDQFERIWALLYTQLGPILLCCWYRRPDNAEVASIQSLRLEYERFKANAIGIVIIGDLNIYYSTWLRFSTHDSAEGRALKSFCDDFGFTENVKASTRDGNFNNWI